jgi:hypothetical protein
VCTLDKSEMTPDQFAKVKSSENETLCEIIQIREDDHGQIFPTLINGRPVDRSDWMEVVRIGNRSCTATMVGPKVAVTAAHCGRHNSRTNVEIYQGPNVAGRMFHMPQWKNRSNWDLAVIVLDDAVDVPFATVALDHVFRVGQDIDIAGYGCTRPGGGGGNDGILRWGESKVVNVSVGTDVATQWRPNGGALCFGDSGGPMFADGSDVGKRTLVAVNSKGNIRDYNLNMRLNWPEVKTFFESIIDRFEVSIFGVNDQIAPPPPPPPPPPGGDKFWQIESQIALTDRQIQFWQTERERLEDSISNGSGPGGGTGSGDLIGGLPPL